MPNRLRHSTSPYLRAHADNPVDWYEWGPEALAEAVRRDVPLLISIGYAACHWCHVMAHESFQDAGVGAYLNAHVVAVKVDREERPDVDAVYMEATLAMTGSGGWPMTVFATPAGRAFQTGTYYPPRPAHGLPSFTQLVAAVVRAWDTDRTRIVAEAARIDAALAGPAPLDAARVDGSGFDGSGFDGAATDGAGPVGDVSGGLTADRLDAAVAVLADDFDPDHPGFGRAPKFPPSTVLGFLDAVAARGGPAAGRAGAMSAATLSAMARGGIHDQLAGGFARYAVDRAWAVPHFEKMLYDNALLLAAYTRAATRTPGDGDAAGSPGDAAIRPEEAERVARGIAGFLLGDLRTAEGGFAASLDADTAVPGPDGTVHGVEGATYVWTPAQLADVLGPADGAWAAGIFGVTPAGTFEHGTSTLQLPAGPPPDSARFDRVRDRLLAARRERPQPARDEKVVTAWNALAVEALVRAGAVFGEPGWIAAAAAAAALLLSVNRDPAGRVLRTSRDGVPGTADGALEDVAALAGALLTLAGATGEPRWSAEAERLLDDLARFADGAGGFWDTAADSHARSGLPRRPRDPADGPSPSGTHLAASALLASAALTGSPGRRAAAAAALGPAADLLERAPRAVGAGLSVAEALLSGPVEVAVVGPAGDPARAELARTAWRLAPPGAVVAVGGSTVAAGASGGATIPLLAGRGLLDGRSAAYVCRGFTCRRPVTDSAALAAELAAAGSAG